MSEKEFGLVDAIPAVTRTVIAVADNLLDYRRCVSKNTATALLAAFGWATTDLLKDPKIASENFSKMLALTNFIYRANNWFDIGLFAQKEIVARNSGYAFTALEKIHSTTRELLSLELAKLTQKWPELEEFAQNLLNDGEVLATERNKFATDELTYSEIDNAINAVMYFGAFFGNSFLDDIGIQGDKLCRSVDELKQKYGILLGTSSLSPKDMQSFSRNRKIATGMQAIAMILAYVDDRLAGGNDELLGIPNTHKPKGENNPQISGYRRTAISCGFPALAVDAIEILSLIHAVQIRSANKAPSPVELHNLASLAPFWKHILLREFLQKSTVLSQLATH